jgi:V8-like Glu-specific endopeptidase
VEDVIGFLNDKCRDDTKENVLVILVGLLAKQIDPADGRHRTLTELAQELDIVLSSGSSTAPLGQTANPNSKPKLSIVPKKTDNTLPESVPAVRFGQEANPQGESMFFLAVDEKLLTCARSVARVSIPKIIDGRMEQVPVPTGTGWLVTPELALTCWHVIEARGRWDYPISELDLQEQIGNGLLTFNNALPGRGVEYKIEKLEYYNPDLDYALLRLQERAARPLQQWGFLRLDEDEPVTVQTKLLVIQHPKGQPQQRSEGYFVKLASDTNRILHNAPTEQGTSGAPVLKVNNWQVVALHNGENEAEQLREATLISAILSDLRQNRKELHSEISEAQHS